jgi:hypothetical protein
MHNRNPADERFTGCRLTFGRSLLSVYAFIFVAVCYSHGWVVFRQLP